METNDVGDWYFNALVVLAILFMVLLLSIPVGTIVNWDRDKAERAATFECEKAGGEYSWIDSNRESKACMKEYTSCGPDENKPGFTACEQKFKRID